MELTTIEQSASDYLNRRFTYITKLDAVNELKNVYGYAFGYFSIRSAIKAWENAFND